ncbi:unnamed protein product [Phytophthora fragariaefolia]|uniref:Unnamed protein product n=1 Tax=Phytophthora fragariaefolia TaxID=1490495 RepID=A0A9W6Y672_9STRA|nr:unnamed protein product [Phytophthora fragariaefolia]
MDTCTEPVLLDDTSSAIMVPASDTQSYCESALGRDCVVNTVVNSDAELTGQNNESAVTGAAMVAKAYDASSASTLSLSISNFGVGDLAAIDGSTSSATTTSSFTSSSGTSTTVVPTESSSTGSSMASTAESTFASSDASASLSGPTTVSISGSASATEALIGSSGSCALPMSSASTASSGSTVQQSTYSSPSNNSQEDGTPSTSSSSITSSGSMVQQSTYPSPSSTSQETDNSLIADSSIANEGGNWMNANSTASSALGSTATSAAANQPSGSFSDHSTTSVAASQASTTSSSSSATSSGMVQAERNSNNEAAQIVAPPVMPATLARIPLSEFASDILDPRRAFGEVLGSRAVESEHREMCQANMLNDTVKAVLDEENYETNFNNGWDALQVATAPRTFHVFDSSAVGQQLYSPTQRLCSRISLFSSGN